MNIINIIQSALTALNSNADLLLLEEYRADNEELEHTGSVIVVFPDWRTQNKLTQGMELIKTRDYNIQFKTLDEWDNSDNNQDKSYNSSTSVDRINSMEILADSVFSYITSHNDLWPEIQKKLSWSSPRPILRANNGTMSGIEVKLTVVFSGERNCDFSI